MTTDGASNRLDPVPTNYVWGVTAIVVDGASTDFALLQATDERWLAIAERPDLFIIVESEGFPCSTVELERISDPSTYLGPQPV